MALTTIPVELLTLDDGVTITVDDNSDVLTLTSTDADANAGPSLMLFRNSSSPADSDRIGTITYRGKNDAAENVDYIVYDSFIVDASDGTEDAELDIRTMVGGSETTRLLFDPAETVFNEASSDIDFRVESNGNANAIFVDAGNDRVGILNDASMGSNFNVLTQMSIGADNNNRGILDFSSGSFSIGTIQSGTSTFSTFSVSSGAVFCNNSTSLGTSLIINNTSNGSGSTLKFLNDSSSPANDDVLGSIDFNGNDDGGTQTTFARIRASASNVANGSEDGNLAFAISDDASLLEHMRINTAGVVVNELSQAGTDFRVESNDNTHMLFVDSGANGVGVGDASSPGRYFHVKKNSDTDFTNDAFVANSAAIINNGTSGANNFASLAFATEANGEIAMGAVENSSNSAADFVIVTRDSGSRGQRFKIESSGTTFGGNYFFIVDTDTGILRSASDELSIRAGGNDRLVVTSSGASTSGSFSKGSGSFKIDHPLPAKTDTHHLIHSFVEGPQADLIYRGSVDLVGGSATVNIDTVAGMTDGTFVLLNTNVQCFTSNESGWTAIKGSVSGNTLTITAQDNTCTDTISWMVVGERQDQHMKDTDWTDSDGKVIVEPEKN
jgi:hypothetical protein